jgi:CBS domain containing-hemolysin-like protein
MIPLGVFLAATAMLGFAVVDTAFALLMRLPERLEAERERANEALSAYLDDPLRFFIPARLMRGICLVLAMVLLAQALGEGLEATLILLASGVGLYITMGHILPALMVRRSPERVLEFLLPAFSAFANVLAPLTTLLIGWLGGAARGPVSVPFRGDLSPESAANHTTEEQPETQDEHRLLRSVVRFNETLVREVMTPRPDIVAIRADATIDDLRRIVSEQEYSRLPVYTDNLDNIVGLMVVKDLIQMTQAPSGHRKVSDFMRPAGFVPETKRVVDLLREFQQKRFQLAIVVDEYGGTAGLVTVEDVVEELVGEIRDEYDSEAEPIVAESDDTMVFSAKVAIGEMVDRMGLQIEEGDFETVGGYVLARVGRVPAIGERFAFDGVTIEILEAERRRIHKVRIQRAQPQVAEAGA